MGWLTELDAAIQHRLEGIQVAGKRALRSVGPLRATGRSPVPEAMLAADKPALFYAVRRLVDGADGALARVQALLIAQALRGAESAWRGDGEAAGAYDLAEMAARTLAQPDLAGTAGAWLRHQQLAHADGRVVAFVQEYEVAAPGEQILVDGVELIGGRCRVQIVRAAENSQWQSHVLAGSEQLWARWHGRGPQSIALAGSLWSADETGLRQIEARLEQLLADRNLHSLATGSGRTWLDVALNSWQRAGGRSWQPMLGLVGQPVRIEFEQYRQ